MSFCQAELVLFSQICKNMALDQKRPALASDTPPPLARLINSCWKQVWKRLPSFGSPAFLYQNGP